MAETIWGYEIHPACAMLPMMPVAALEEMARDIREHGQQQPVVLYEGKVLDGRNRLRACEMAGVTPEIREWRGDDPTRWVLSLNFHRRHLTEDQKSVVGARAEQLLAERASRVARAEAPAARPVADDAGDGAAATEARAGKAGGDEVADEAARAEGLSDTVDRAIVKRARQTAAALVNVSPSRIARGKKLLDQAVPRLVSAVERGAITMTQAARVSELAPEAQEALVAQGEEAVIDEARRMAMASRAGKPSFQRALSDVDLACAEWSLSKARDGRYVFTGEADEGEVRCQGDDAKAALMAAWTAIHEPAIA